MYLLRALLLPLLALLLGPLGPYPFAVAIMQPGDMQNTFNSLARMAFDLKDLVAKINISKNAGPIQDVFDEFDDIFDSCLSNISLMTGSAVLTDLSQQQLVYEAYSYFVQGIFELMDAVSESAETFIALDKQNEFRIPASIRELAGVTDAFLYIVIALFPSPSSYAMQSANQKSQVDTHFRQAIHAYHIATASTPAPYSSTNTTVVRRRI